MSFTKAEQAPFVSKERNATLVATPPPPVQKIPAQTTHLPPPVEPANDIPQRKTRIQKLNAGLVSKPEAVCPLGSAFCSLGTVIVFNVIGPLVQHLLGDKTSILAQDEFDLIGNFRVFLEEQFCVVTALAQTLRIVGEP